MPRYTFVDEEPKQDKKRYQFIEEPENNLQKNIKEVPKQFAKGAASGGLGSYGDILDLFGLQSKKSLPGEQARTQLEADVLQNLDQPGRTPSLGELDILSEQEPIQQYSRLPSSEQVSEIIEGLGGPGKPETLAGKYSSRLGQFIGGGLASGSGALKGPALAAGAGQLAEELKLPKWMQAAVEIGTLLKTNKRPNLLASNDKEITKELARLKKLGFSDEDLTLAKNALEDRGWLKKVSVYNDAAAKRFADTAKNTETNLNRIVESSLPGLTKEGSAPFKEASSQLFESLDNLAKNVMIGNPKPFIKSANAIIDDLEKTLARVPQKQQVIDLLEKAKVTADTQVTADYFTNFYKDLNAIGQWGNPKQREYVFSKVKDAIKDTFKQNGPEGKKLAMDLEKANKSYVKYLQAEDVSELLKKATTEDGINFKKLSSLLDKSDQMKVLQTGIGEVPAKNLKKIANAGMKTEALRKKIEGSDFKKLFETAKLYEFFKSVVTLDVSKMKNLLGTEVAGRFATKLLTDPAYQNIHLKLLEAINTGKLDHARVLARNLQKNLQEE